MRKEIPGKSQTCCSFTVILFEALFLYRFATQIEANLHKIPREGRLPFITQ